jgi:hypothetical protein
MGMSGVYGATDDAESVRTIQTAVDRGVTLIDTGEHCLSARPAAELLAGHRRQDGRSARRRAGALAHHLSGDDLAALDQLVSASAIGGERYGGEQMRNLDSER